MYERACPRYFTLRIPVATPAAAGLSLFGLFYGFFFALLIYACGHDRTACWDLFSRHSPPAACCTRSWCSHSLSLPLLFSLFFRISARTLASPRPWGLSSESTGAQPANFVGFAARAPPVYNHRLSLAAGLWFNPSECTRFEENKIGRKREYRGWMLGQKRELDAAAAISAAQSRCKPFKSAF